jgi:methyl coenzyme M reductase gamma subunit
MLKQLFVQANRDKGPIPVKVKLNGYSFKQTLVKYAGKWRLYLNTPMRKATRLEVGDSAKVSVEFDPGERKLTIHPKLETALSKNKSAKEIFDSLPPSRRKEIIRYIGLLKSDEAVDKNVQRALWFLNGKHRFIGRDHP